MNTLLPDTPPMSHPARTEGRSGPQVERRKRLLYVDDDPSIRRICQLVLTRSGYDVNTAADGAEAWAELCSSDYDLVITDHQMPRLTGLELIRQLRRANSGLPVVLASGALEELSTDELHWLECDRILAKPFAPAELLSAVCDALQAAPSAEPPVVHHWGLNEWNKLRKRKQTQADSAVQRLVPVGI